MGDEREREGCQSERESGMKMTADCKPARHAVAQRIFRKEHIRSLFIRTRVRDESFGDASKI